MQIDLSKVLKLTAGIIAFIIIYFVLLNILKQFGITAQDIRNFIQNLGALGILFLFFFMALSVMSPFPDSPAALIAIIVYGPIVGFVIILLGSLAGAVIDFFLFRKLGRNFFKKKFPIWEENLNRIAKKFGFESMIFLRIFPTVTFDIVSYAAAFTKVRFATFVVSTLLGLLPLALTYSIIGTGIESNNTKKIILTLVIGFAVLLLSVIFSQYYGKKFNLNKLEGDSDKTDEGVL